MSGYRYKGFISYSRSDVAVAKRLHRSLERIKVPVRSPAPGKKTGALSRLGRFFRDDDEMGASSDLGEALRGALKDSEALIVICSPRAARSKWVNQEIIDFKRSRSTPRIFAVISAGEPNAAASSADPDKECFPPALIQTYLADGRISPLKEEPRAADLRRRNLGQRPFARVVHEVAAGLSEIAFDTLWQRRKRAARRARMLWLSAIFAAGLVASNVWFAARMTDQSEMLLGHAASAIEDGDITGAIRTATFAIQNTGALKEEFAALLQLAALKRADIAAFGKVGGDDQHHMVTDFSTLRFPTLAVSQERALAAISRHNGSIDLVDPASGTVIGRLRSNGPHPKSMSLTADGTRLAVLEETGRIFVMQTEPASVLDVIDTGLELPVDVRISQDGAWVAASEGTVSGKARVRTWRRTETGYEPGQAEILHGPELPTPSDIMSRALEASADQNRLWLCGELGIDCSEDDPAPSRPEPGDFVKALLITQDNRHVVSASRDGAVRKTRLSSGQSLVRPVHKGWIDAVDMHEPAGLIVSTGSDGRLAALSLPDLRITSSLELVPPAGRREGPLMRAFQDVAISGSGSKVAAVTEDQRLCVAALPLRRPLWCADIGERGLNVTWIKQDLQLVVTTSEGSLRVFQASDGSLLSKRRAHRLPVGTVEVIDAIGLLLTASRDDRIRIWKADDLGPEDRWPDIVHHGPSADILSFAKAGLAGGPEPSSEISPDAAGRVENPFRPPVLERGAGPGARRLLLGYRGDGGIELPGPAAPGKFVRRISDGREVVAMSLSAIGSEGVLLFGDLSKSTWISEADLGDRITALDLTEDGRRIAVSLGTDGRICILASGNFEDKRCADTGTGMNYRVKFIPGTDYLVSADYAGQLITYDVSSLERVGAVSLSAGRLYAMDVSASGRLAIAIDEAGQIHIANPITSTRLGTLETVTAKDVDLRASAGYALILSDDDKVASFSVAAIDVSPEDAAGWVCTPDQQDKRWLSQEDRSFSGFEESALSGQVLRIRKDLNVCSAPYHASIPLVAVLQSRFTFLEEMFGGNQ